MNPLLRPAELKHEMQTRGLVVLAVTEFYCNPEVLVVYLHGNAGQSADGHAKRVIERIPAVVKAEESVSAHTILLVRVYLPGGEDGRI